MKTLLAGTFDPIHPGHINLMWRAKRNFGGPLYVIVARDENVIHFKGRPPAVPDYVRAFIVANLKPVDYVFIGSQNVMEWIEYVRPEVIVLGYDQRPSEGWLKKEINNLGIEAKIVRAPRFDTGVGSSTEFKRQIYRWYVKYCKRFLRLNLNEETTLPDRKRAWTRRSRQDDDIRSHQKHTRCI